MQVLLCHPDKRDRRAGPLQSEADGAFLRVQEAWAVLKVRGVGRNEEKCALAADCNSVERRMKAAAQPTMKNMH